VISFEADWSHGPAVLERALNAKLPDAIAVRELAVTKPGFHPRFDARRRTYEYNLYNWPNRSPLRARYTWHVRQPLDVYLMNEAASALLGRRDFATFGKAPQGENTVREVYEAQWQLRGVLLVFTIAANAFLYRMVRSIVASLQRVGAGEWRPEDFVAALHARDRGQAAGTAPAQGLVLAAVDYDN
jgi:tRNA pseudouridine38-40 synthase